MKKFLLIFLSALFGALFLSAKEVFINPTSIVGTLKNDDLYLVSKNIDPNKSGSVAVVFDISCFTKTQTAGAALNVWVKNFEEGLSSCLYATVDGKIAASGIINSRPEETAVRLIVTQYVNEALKAGKKQISFNLEVRGLPNTQRPFGIKQGICLSLVDEAERPFVLNEYLRPIWKAGKMTNESVFLIEPESGGCAEASLIFTPTKIMSVRNSALDKEYVSGKDYEIVGNKIRALPDSAMPNFKYDFVFRKTEDASDMRLFKFPKLKRFAISPEGTWFHEHQVFVTYEHSGENWNGYKFAENFDSKKLPKTIERLKNNEPLKIALFGDSISAGANASGMGGKAPYMPSFGDIIFEALTKYYKNDKIEFSNTALSGATFSWGEKHVDALVAPENPNLVIIAFGMNGSDTPQEHYAKAKFVMEKIRDKNPDAEFILVALMLPNPDWRRLVPHENYAAELKKFESSGVFIADIWNAHSEILRHKKYSDTTGNHVNHPNDFLIRVYAQAILEPLMPLE